MATREELEAVEREVREDFMQECNKAIEQTLQKYDKLRLKREQELLLRKVIDFSTLQQYDSEDIRNRLYTLFFEVFSVEKAKMLYGPKDRYRKHADGAADNKTEDTPDQNSAGDREDGKDVSSDHGAPSTKDDKEEKKKAHMVKMDQELHEFEERGGFARVLRDIFNPTDQSSIELDSVYQLKQLVRTYYSKKTDQSTQLIQCLDALANERPWTLRLKKKHFDLKNSNIITDLEYMRINAERERIQKYQDITKGSAYTYYNILKRLTDEYDRYKKDPSRFNTGADRKAQGSPNQGSKDRQSAETEERREVQDPLVKIQQALKESRLQSLLHFITGKYTCSTFAQLTSHLLFLQTSSDKWSKTAWHSTRSTSSCCLTTSKPAR
jgi:hypothetical protein